MLIMKTIKILIADDDPTDCQNLLNKLTAYFKAKKILESDYEIITTHTIDSTIELLSSSNYFDIFFADINFSEGDSESGKRNGYLLIRKAFEACPLTFICVYSGTADEDFSGQKKYVDLFKRGMLADIYKKDSFQLTTPTKFNNRFKNAWKHVISKQFIWDLWNNHKLILAKLNEPDTASCSEIIKNNISEIEKNLDSILFLLKNINNPLSDAIVYRLCLQLYHRCLEIFCEGEKKDEDIFAQSEKNKTILAKLINKDKDWNLGDKITALRKIVAYSDLQITEYGYRLNDWRNRSVHLDKDFIPNLVNILFANLTLALFVNGKNGIHFKSFEQIPDIEKEKGFKDLKELIDFIR